MSADGEMQLNNVLTEFDLWFARSFIEDYLRGHLFDGPVDKPLQTSEWYRQKRTNLEGQLALIATQNEVKKSDCSQHIKRWVSSTR